MATSRIPFLGTARRLKRALSYTPPPPDYCANTINSESSSTLTSGSATPVMQAASLDVLSMTQLDSVLYLSQSRKDGIDWTSAALGHQMLVSASRRAERNDDLLSRTMYIDALKYLHSSLPADLSVTEQQSLCNFLPRNLFQESDSTRECSIPESSNSVRSYTASFVAFFVGLIMLAMPVLTTAINRIFVYERKHQIIPRLVGASNEALQIMGTTGFTVGERIFRLSQSQMTAYALVGIIGLMSNIANGVSDGFERSFQSCMVDREGQRSCHAQ